MVKDHNAWYTYTQQMFEIQSVLLECPALCAERMNGKIYTRMTR